MRLFLSADPAGPAGGRWGCTPPRRCAVLRRAAGSGGARHGAAGAPAEGVVHPRDRAGHRGGAARARRRRQRG